MKRLSLLTFFMISLLASAGLANTAPTAEPIFIVGWDNTPYVLTIIVHDADIDPLAPEIHPIAFSIATPPARGVVTGDLEGITYQSPTNAVLVLTYTPADDFTGIDTFVIRAEDPEGESIDIAITAEIAKRGSHSTLSGTTRITVTADVQTGSLTSANVSGRVRYSTYATSMEMGYLFKRETASDRLFDDLYFTFASPLSSFAALSARVDFNPDSLSNLFDYAAFSGTVYAGAATLSSTLRLGDVQTASSLVVGLSGTAAEGLSYSLRARFVPCTAFFSDATVSLGVDIPCGPDDCMIDVDASLGVSCEGFESLSISASNIALPAGALLNLAERLDATLRFDLQTKSLTITPRFQTTWMDCIRFGVHVDWSELALKSIEFQSIHLSCTLANGITLQSDTSLDPENLTLNQTVTGHLDYWEKDAISGQFEMCSGIGGSWEVAVYFSRPDIGVALFSWGMLELSFDIRCGTQWRFFTEATFRSGVFGDSTCEFFVGAEFGW